ncbi:whirlin-like [Diadema antillarum]|uniref:whirlin-like n=1 Tax=Diadema antillarum TaxID=105358 RepID=UPI003A854C71
MSLRHPPAPPRARSRISSGGHGSGSRTMSANVRRLHESLTTLLAENDKSHFVHALNEYNSKRNVYTLVQNLKSILNTPEKKQLYVLLGKVIPSSDQSLFWQNVESFCTIPGSGPSRPVSSMSNTSTNNISSNRGMHSRPESRLYEQNGRNRANTSLLQPNSLHLPNSQHPQPQGFQQNQSYYEQQPQHQLHQEQQRPSLQQIHQGGEELHGKTVRKTSGAQWSNDQTRDLKRVVLRKSELNGGGLGFSIRGGAEHSVGIYVSLVEPRSLAEKRGLHKGDQIVQVNDLPFEKISHADAVKILKNTTKLVLYVKSVGRVPGSFLSHQTYTWVDPNGRSVSPPPDIDPLRGRMLNDSQNRKSSLNLLKSGDEKKVNVVVNEGESLGLMIRGGKEFGLGIYITGIDTYSVADDCGLKVGDQIMDVNGRNFLDIEHQEAVDILKSSKLMMMTIKDVGKLPYARTTIDRTQWLTGDEVDKGSPTLSRQGVRRGSGGGVIDETDSLYSELPERPESAFSRGIGSQMMYSKSMAGVQNWSMLEDQSRTLLNDNERGTMMYYLEEYQHSTITVDALVMALFELFDTHAKFSLLSEIRAFIHPRDIDRFDSLVLKKEVEAMKARQRGYFMNERETSFTDTMSNSSRYNSSSSIDSRPLTPPQVPKQLPPNIRVINEPEDRYQGIDTRQINDDTNGLPDFALPDYAIGSPINNNSGSTPNQNQHRSSPSPSTFKPKSLFNSLDSPNIQKVTVDVHYNSHLPEEPSTSGRGVGLPLEPMYISTKSPSEDSGVDLTLTNGYTNGNINFDKLKTLTSSPNSMASDTDISPRSSEVSPRLPDCNTQLSSDRGTDIGMKSSKESTSASMSTTHSGGEPRPARSHSRQRRMSLDSVSTEGSNSVVGELISRQNSGTDGIPRRISDPTHHTPKDQKRSVNQTKKASETLYELRKSNPTSPVSSSSSSSSPASNHRLPSSTQKSKPGSHLSRHQRPVLPPPPPPPATTRETSQSLKQPNPMTPPVLDTTPSQEEMPPPPTEFLEDTLHAITLPSPLPSPPPDQYLGDAPPLPSTTPPPPPPEFQTDDDDDDDNNLVLPDPSSYSLSEGRTGSMSHERLPVNTQKTQVKTTSVKSDEALVVDTREDRPPHHEIIVVRKSKPNLGIAVEGGSGTRQPLPKIIKVQYGGSAYHSSNLKVGHVILRVNGKPLHDLSHSQATRVIAEGFKQKSSDSMEFMVVDSNKFKLVY